MLPVFRELVFAVCIRKVFPHMSHTLLAQTSSTTLPTDRPLAAVAYCDGSCKYSNPGHIGWGVHGYIYHLDEVKTPVVVDGHLITDRGYVAADKRKYHADKIRDVEVVNYFDFMGSSLQIGSNNYAEMQAVYLTLQELEMHNLTAIAIYTDSEYVKKGLIDWCRNWEYAGWKKPDGSYVANYEQWVRLYSKYKQLKATGMELRIEWVKGHNDVMGNVQADILAGTASNCSLDKVVKEVFKYSPGKHYWKPEIERHPFMNFKRVYFNSVPEYNVPGHYFQADSGAADHLIGKRIPESGFSVIRLHEPDVAIESVKARQYDVSKELNAIVMMKLDRVYSKDIHPYLVDHGKYALNPSRKNLNVEFFDKQPVTVEMNPTGLSMRAIDSFNLLEELLEKFHFHEENGYDHTSNRTQLNCHDLTSFFFDIEHKVVKKGVPPVEKHKLKTEFIPGMKNTSVAIVETYKEEERTVQVPLIMGIDMPPRNNLKRLEDESPKVCLITWRESENSIRYATVITCQSGVGIWSNFFADKIFFTP